MTSREYPSIVDNMPAIMNVQKPNLITKMHRGVMIAPKHLTDAQLMQRAQYLVASLSVNSRAQDYAAEHEVVFVDDEHGLRMICHQEDANDFLVACWQDEEVCKVFEMFGLRVHV